MSFPSRFAQTNVQLFNQLRSEGYSRDDRQRVFEAYEFGIGLFSSLFLPSGKPFIDHLVGTASILASVRAHADIVAAALLHAAYLHGDFGNARNGFTSAKQQALRSAVGQAIEDYVTRYHHLQWNPQRIPVVRASLDNFQGKDREVLFIRLVNELEHHLDFGALYFAGRPNAQAGHQRYLQRYGPMMVEMMERLGHPALAAEMNDVFSATINAPLPIAPCIRTTRSEAYCVSPASYSERLPVALRRQMGDVYRLGLRVLRRAKSVFLKHPAFMHRGSH